MTTNPPHLIELHRRFPYQFNNCKFYYNLPQGWDRLFGALCALVDYELEHGHHYTQQEKSNVFFGWRQAILLPVAEAKFNTWNQILSPDRAVSKRIQWHIYRAEHYSVTLCMRCGCVGDFMKGDGWSDIIACPVCAKQIKHPHPDVFLITN